MRVLDLAVDTRHIRLSIPLTTYPFTSGVTAYVKDWEV